MIAKSKKQTGVDTEAKRRKRIIDAFGKFEHTSTSSSAFSQRKQAEIKRENRRKK
jgi:hypothetical protein